MSKSVIEKKQNPDSDDEVEVQMQDMRQSIDVEKRNFWSVALNGGKKYDVQTMLTKTNVQIQKAMHSLIKVTGQ